MAPACQLCGSVKGGFRKGTMFSAHLSVLEKGVPLALALMPDTSVPPSSAFQAATLVLELRGNESE